MSELEVTYGDRADFVIVPPAETMERGAEIEAFGFSELKHGLVVLDGEGEVSASLAGHRFGRDEIERALRTALDS